ncbi:MAG: DUF6758 family protein [Nocardioidaceae bacterium]
MASRLTVVEPLAAVVGGELARVRAPVWALWPLPLGWTFAGFAHDGNAALGQPAGCTVASWLGTDPFDEPVEMLLVCEEPGAAVGSRFAGVGTGYPSAGVGEGAPHARFTIGGRPVPLWVVDGRPDRAAYAGEAAGRWLWVIVHPAEASALVVQPISLVDARTLGAEIATLPVAELSPRLMLD